MGRGQPETSYPRAFTVGVDMAEVTYLQADGIIDRVDFGEIPPKGRIFPHGFRENLGKGAGSSLRVGNQEFEGC